MDAPETRYAKTPDGLSIAYHVAGDGPTDIVLLPSLSCIDVMWMEPSCAHVLHRLAKIGRLVCFDRRGSGSSDPVPLGALPTHEAWMDDLRVVLDAVGSTSVSVVAHGSTGYMGMLFAATYPERTNALIFVNSTARVKLAEDYPFGATPEQLEAFARVHVEAWGTGANVSFMAPSRSDDEPYRRWYGWLERLSQNPATVEATLGWLFDLDLRSVLPTIRVPTLVLHREAGQVPQLDQGRYLADHIAGARLVVVPGTDYEIISEHADEIIDHIEEFITGAPPVREPDRALATVLFTDIVASTEHATRLGDKKWTQLLDQHDALIRRELDRHRGRRVNPTGDGILASFDGPARAVRCAQAIVEAVRPLGIEVRAGLHTGEVELRGDDIGGIAVHIGQRVSALARPGEVLVSRTVTDLVAGSGLEFEDRGEHELKGVPGKWAIYAVTG